MNATALRPTTSRAAGRRPARVHPFLIVAVCYWLASIAIVGAGGNFPLNDDWIYGSSVRHMLATGQFNLYSSLPSCLLQVVAGAAVCHVFGFSYEVLRALSLASGLGAVCLLYLIVRETGAGRRLAGLSALVFACNPLLINVSFAFMSDPMFLAFVNAYFLCLLKGIRKGSPALFLIAGLLLMCAMAVRQIAGLFIAGHLLLLFCLSLRTRSLAMYCFTLIVMPSIWMLAVDSWHVAALQYPQGYEFSKAYTAGFAQRFFASPLSQTAAIVSKSAEVLSYLGLFTLPVLFPFMAHLGGLAKSPLSRLAVGAVGGAAITCAGLVKAIMIDGRCMPYSKNLWAIPSITAMGTFGMTPSLWLKPLHWLVTYIAGLLAIVLGAVIGAGAQTVAHFARKRLHGGRLGREHAGRRTGVVLACVLWLAITGAAIVQLTSFSNFDRYYLIAVGPLLAVMAILARWWRVRTSTGVSLYMVALLALVSIGAQQEYMNWNRAKWKVIATAESLGATVQTMDGSSEYNFVRDPDLVSKLEIYSDCFAYPLACRGDAPRNLRRWWPVHAEKYIISFTPLPGYEVIGKEPYWASLNLSTREIYLLKRR